MGISPHEELFAKNCQLVEVKALYCCSCGNCGKPFAFETTVDNITEEEVFKSWDVCPHCDYENTIVIKVKEDGSY